MIGWTGSHVVVFLLLAGATSLLFDGHPRVGRAWGLLLHFVLPGAVGCIQAFWLRGFVRNRWLWILASILGLAECLILSEGWGVLPVLGFGMGLLQAAIIRPWGFRFVLLWITLAGLGWMLAWEAAPALDHPAPGWLLDPVRTAGSPVLETTLAGLIYGLFTSPILFISRSRRPHPASNPFHRFPFWIPAGMLVSMVIVTFYAGVYFGRLLQARDFLFTLISGSPDPTMTRWADLLIVLTPLVAGEITYRCMTWNYRSVRIWFSRALSFPALVRGVDGGSRRH
jgi:hypothetical protein